MPEKPEKDVAIGIDLGTTNSLAAVVRNGKPLALSGEHGPLVPSVIGIRGHEVIIGRRAYDSMVDNPEQTVFSIKRLIGKSIREIDGEGAELPFKIIADGQGLALVEIDRRTYSPVELSAAILREVKRQAEMALRQIISRAVITVPAYFDDVQRQATRDAGRIAGLEVLRIINEPTAAALAYGLDRMKQGLVAVYDLGGGTFDVSILKLENGIFEVLSTAGDTRLGGDDFDAALADFMAAEINRQGVSIDRTLPKTKALLKRRAEEAKKALSGRDDIRISLNFDGQDRVIEITRERFETMISPIVARTFSLCRRVLSDADLSVGDLDAVILVGGSTRVPLVRREVERFFGRTPRCELGPDEVVALGAAIQADILTGGRDDLLLLDVTPLSLGIETLGGVMNVLIRRNSKIPSVAKEMFTTYVDGQTAVAIRIFQGERELVAGNRLLGDFTLTGIAPVKAGLPRIEVDFTLDADGILNVRARETRSGRSQDIVVRPAYGLTEDEVKRMVRASFIHARDDIEKRLVIELSQEAARVIEATEKSLPQAGDGRPGEKEKTEAALAEMKKALTGEDSHTLRLALDNLNEATADLAARLVNGNLRGLLKDKTVGEAEKLVNKGI